MFKCFAITYSKWKINQHDTLFPQTTVQQCCSYKSLFYHTMSLKTSLDMLEADWLN